MMMQCTGTMRGVSTTRMGALAGSRASLGSARALLRPRSSHLAAPARRYEVSCVQQPHGKKNGTVKAPPLKALAMDLEVAPEPEKKTRVRNAECKLRIDGEWYDLTNWAKAHPGGERFVRFFNGKDATDVFYALHSYGPNASDEALRRLKRLPKCEAPADAQLPDAAAAAQCENFRDFRKKLEQDGWFERDPIEEVKLLAKVFVPLVAGSCWAWAGHGDLIATFLIALGMQQAGWLGHDYIHGRGPWCERMRSFAGWINGHSSYWWSQKHSMHHVFTNEHGKDEDITQEPFFYLTDPKKSSAADSAYRKYQHLYGYPLYLVTFALWRVDSLRTIFKLKLWHELAPIALNYLYLATLPPLVAIGAVFLSGFMVGSIVSATHQSEEVMFEQGEFVDIQFRSTRDAEVKNPVMEMLWGGMDTQLEHHLFPTMPRYKYHKLRPLLQAFAAKQPDYKYLISSDTEIIRQNWATLREFAK